MAYKVGDIVKFKDKHGNEVVGIIYENGNKSYGDFRVKAIGIKKYRHLIEGELEPAPFSDLIIYGQSQVVPFIPGEVIKQETEASGGTLPDQIIEKPVFHSSFSEEE